MRGELVIERELAHPPERVWSQVTSPRGGAAFFHAQGFRAEVGHRFRATVPRGPGFDGAVQVEVLEVEAPERLRMSWRGGPVAGEVRLTVEPLGEGGSRLVLVQTGFDRAEQQLLAPALLAAWQGRVDGLPAVLAGVGGGVGGASAGVLGATVLSAVVGVAALLAALVGVWLWLGGAAVAGEGAGPERTAGAGGEVHGLESGGEVDPADDVGDSVPGGTGVRGGVLTVFEEEMPRFNPLYPRGMVDVRSQELVFDRLFYQDAGTGEMRSRLVRKFQVQDGGLALLVTLRGDVRWHDGTPLTAADVCFTVAAQVHVDNPIVGRIDGEGAVACEVQASDAALLHFARPSAYPLDAASFPILPAHVFGGDPVIPRGHDFAMQPVGTGPFSVSVGRRRSHLTRYVNPHHDALLDGIEIVEAGDPFVAVRTLAAGGVHGMVAVEPVMEEAVTGLDVHATPYATQRWVTMTLNADKLDLDLRTAVDAALDREALVQVGTRVPKSLADQHQLAQGPFLPGDRRYPASATVRPGADPAAVEQAMERAGAVREAGRWLRDDEPVMLRVGVQSDLSTRAPGLLDEVRNQLTLQGFTVQIYKVSQSDWATMTPAKARPYHVLIGDQRALTSSDVRAFLHRDGPQNLFGQSDPELDAALEGLDGPDRADAAAAAVEVVDLVERQRRVLFLWSEGGLSAWSPAVRGAVITPYYFWTEVDRWWLEP